MTDRYRYKPPEYIAPDDTRCQAMVPGHPSWSRECFRVDHQCYKAANQARGDMIVCHVHARAKEAVKWQSNQNGFKLT